MRALAEESQTRFYVCFAVAIGSVMGIAFSANLFTMFIFYEVLTFSTFPLVTHKRTPEAIRSGAGLGQPVKEVAYQLRGRLVLEVPQGRDDSARPEGMHGLVFFQPSDCRPAG